MPQRSQKGGLFGCFGKPHGSSASPASCKDRSYASNRKSATPATRATQMSQRTNQSSRAPVQSARASYQQAREPREQRKKEYEATKEKYLEQRKRGRAEAIRQGMKQMPKGMDVATTKKFQEMIAAQYDVQTRQYLINLALSR